MQKFSFVIDNTRKSYNKDERSFVSSSVFYFSNESVDSNAKKISLNGQVNFSINVDDKQKDSKIKIVDQSQNESEAYDFYFDFEKSFNSSFSAKIEVAPNLISSYKSKVQKYLFVKPISKVSSYSKIKQYKYAIVFKFLDQSKISVTTNMIKHFTQSDTKQFDTTYKTIDDTYISFKRKSIESILDQLNYDSTINVEIDDNVNFNLYKKANLANINVFDNSLPYVSFGQFLYNEDKKLNESTIYNENLKLANSIFKKYTTTSYNNDQNDYTNDNDDTRILTYFMYEQRNTPSKYYITNINDINTFYNFINSFTKKIVKDRSNYVRYFNDYQSVKMINIDNKIVLKTSIDASNFKNAFEFFVDKNYFKSL